MMKCKNCGNEFSEGFFCPECGEKYEENVSEIEINREKDNQFNEDPMQEAKGILEEYNKIEEERKKIEEIGWSDVSDVKKSILLHIEELRAVRELGLESEYAYSEIQNMRSIIKNEYYDIKEKTSSVGGQIIFAAIVIVLSVIFLVPYGTVRKVFGILLILGSIGSVIDCIKDNGLLMKLEEILEKENIIK